MLGSYFDLKREIARIAARRAIAEAATSNEAATRAYSDFDDRLRHFMRSARGEDIGPGSARSGLPPQANRPGRSVA